MITEKNILKFWKAIESLTPQNIADEEKGIDLSSVTEPSLPWNNTEKKATDKKDDKEKKPIWIFRCGIYSISELKELIEDKIGTHEQVFDDYKDRAISRLFDLCFDEEGFPIPESFVLSMACWCSGQILKYDIDALEKGDKVDLTGLPAPGRDIPLVDTGYSGFDELSRSLMQYLKDEASRLKEDHKPVRVEWLRGFIDLVKERCYLNRDIITNKCRFKVEYKKRKETEEKEKANEVSEIQADSMLNSFFISDLQRLLTAWTDKDKDKDKDIGKGLYEYITAIIKRNDKRIDLREKRGIDYAFSVLSPKYFPPACWPSEHPLVFSQQLAVNEIYKRLKDNSGIFAVNGPPGTGKTTLLRDVVASIVTERAKYLVNEPDIFEQKKTFKIGEKFIPYYPLKVKETAIVVASSNNGAVENISLELPGKSAVPESLYEDKNIDYFKDIAKEVLKKESWALIAARLGRKSNRSDFLSCFWWGTDSINNLKSTRKKEENHGLKKHLEALKEGNKQAYSWERAVADFQNALKKEQEIRKRLIDILGKIEQCQQFEYKIGGLETKINILDGEIKEFEREEKALKTKLEVLRRENEDILRLKQEVEQKLDQHIKIKPGILDCIITLGKSHRLWWKKCNEIENKIKEIESQYETSNKKTSKIEKKYKDTLYVIDAKRKELDSAREDLNKTREIISKLKESLDMEKEKLNQHRPDPEMDDSKREQSSPWLIPEWQKARIEVFLSGLMVHRAFVENHPEQMITNLNLASDWLQGKEIPEEVAKDALESLCLVVPVISTTFASVSRMFKNLGRESIGWLLIDEAGQALPQHAAGAIWRAKRTIVVGDPNQLEPVITIPPTIEGAIAKYYGVERYWWPTATSCQRLADSTMDIGTYLPCEEEENNRIWVGLPLRVHRRCSEPMFSVCNKIAYDGLMIQGKKEEVISLPASSWIHVSGNDAEGNWIKEEGEITRVLIDYLVKERKLSAKDIFLISPFRTCAGKLREIARFFRLDYNKVGTVHTTQGKESDVVIIVLGGNPQKPGAKDWAAGKPNLLNVAVSRAKNRLYVVGNYDEWEKRKYFSVLCNALNKVDPSEIDSLFMISS